MSINIAIDGPAGAGKSTIARAVAAELGFIYVDTGALYRTVALHAKRQGAETPEQIAACLNTADISLCFAEGTQHVLLCGEDVSGLIRTPEISMAASVVSALPAVRQYLFDLQLDMAKQNNVIMDGRDIGTVVLPHADLKIFLTASPRSVPAAGIWSFPKSRTALPWSRFLRTSSSGMRRTVTGLFLPCGRRRMRCWWIPQRWISSR